MPFPPSTPEGVQIQEETYRAGRGRVKIHLAEAVIGVMPLRTRIRLWLARLLDQLLLRGFWN